MPTFRSFFLLLFAYVYLTATDIRGEEQSYDFHYLTTEKGLHQNTIKAIVKDSQGFMWFATRDGLVRYDGNNYMIYRNKSTDQASLVSNSIWQLKKDDDGKIWIGTDKGLDSYDPEKNEFTRIYPKPEDEPSNEGQLVGSILTQYSDEIWFAVFNVGLFVLDKRTNNIHLIEPEEEADRTLLSKITDLEKENSNNFLISSLDGHIFRMTRQNRTLTKVALPGINNLRKQKISSLLVDANQTIWIGTHSGLYYLENENNRVLRLETVDSLYTGYNTELIESLAQDENGNIWVGTRQGLLKITPEKITTLFMPENDTSNDLTSNYIRCLYADSDGIMWGGTVGGGVLYWHKKEKQFNNFEVPTDLSSEKAAYCTIEDKSGFIWIGNERGLFKLDKNGQLFRHYTTIGQPNKVLSDNFVTALAEDALGNIWIGTDQGGINYLNPQNDEIQQFGVSKTKPGMLRSPSVWYIYISSDSTVWVGTGGGGLSRYDKKLGHFITYLNAPSDSSTISSNNVGPVYEDHSGQLWVGTFGGGLNRFNKVQESFEKIEYLPDSNCQNMSDNIVSIDQKGPGSIWVATDNGFYALDTNDESMTCYDSFVVLNGGNVRALIRDNNNDIWISTSREIIKYDLETGKHYQYDTSDGFPGNEFLSGSAFKTTDGRIMFGGIRGVVSFSPESIKNNESPPPVVLSQYRIYNEKDKEWYGWKTFMDQPKEIKLRPYQSIINFDFAALSFINPLKNNYSYRLEGFDPQWSLPGKDHTVTYTRLPAGTYYFLVKASNNDNIWNNEGLRIKLTVLHPFWKTWWFRMILILSWVLVFYALYLNRIRQIKLRKLVLERQVVQRTSQIEKQKTEIAQQAKSLQLSNIKLQEQQVEIKQQADKLLEMDKMKSSFFTNITHEFRTPLTLIISPIEKLIEQTNTESETYKEFKLIRKNAYQILKLINQLLDLAKAESGFMKTQVEYRNINGYIQSILTTFESRAKKYDINYVFNACDKNLMAYVDSDKIEKIITNLISNAFQFTPKRGTISLALNSPPVFDQDLLSKLPGKPGDYLEIIIKDSGEGIPADKMPFIFDRFYCVQKNKYGQIKGTGIGLALTKQLVELHKGTIKVESTPNQGTTFRVTIPIERSHYEWDEILNENNSQLQEYSEMDSPDKIYDSENDEILHEEKPSGKTEKPHILIVEDNIEVRRYIVNNLRSVFHISQAEDGLKGFTTALDNPPDLIVSDVMMPNMDGFEFCSQIKSDDRTNHIPVILLTARVGSADQISGLEIGADAYIMKPFNVRVLEARIKNIISQRIKLRQLFSQRFVLEPSKIELESQDKIFISKAIDLIENNMDNSELDVVTFASELGMSRTQLYNKIKAITDMPVHNFITSIRLKRAAQLLLEENFTVYEISIMVGFNNPKYFSRLFKKQFGMLPTEYRSKNLVN